MNAHQRRKIAGQLGDSLMLRGGCCGCEACTSRGWSSRRAQWIHRHDERLNGRLDDKPLPDLLGGGL